MANDLSLFRGVAGVERAKDIIERMRGHEIPPTPENYEIWTAHVAGVRPDLSREIDERLTRGESFTDEVNADLFERFFANTRLSLQILETSQTIARDLGDSVSTLRGAGEKAGAYAEVLQAAMGELGDSQSVLAQLKDATHGMIQHSLDMAEQLEASSRQVEALKAALQSVKVDALTDGITGLANRKMFDETLERRMRDAVSAGSDLCVLLIETDNFTRLCEHWGKTLGDQVLRYVAAVLQAHAQGDLLAARCGGENFALIMPRTNLALAEALAVRVNRATKSKRLALKSTGDRISEIPVSIGVACFSAPEIADTLLARARGCLLAAKAAGRDRVITDLQLRRLTAA
jgi:diguanylate cyclase